MKDIFRDLLLSGQTPFKMLAKINYAIGLVNRETSRFTKSSDEATDPVTKLRNP
jgi:hypothetical protein